MDLNNLKTRQLTKNEDIPYSLLLLADETVEAINRYIFDSEIFILEENGAAIAVYALQKLNADEAEIKNIAVAPAFQDKGLGKLLLNDATKRAKAQGFKAILIGTG
jgi:aminoglycoside 6'-N-acetyltransferase I